MAMMAADASTPLLADPDRPTTPSSYAGSIEPPERPSLFRRVPSLNPHFNLPHLRLTPILPYTTTLHPTLYLRSLSLTLLLPAFILFLAAQSRAPYPHYSPVITFLSFALARQLWILIAHFGSQVIVIRIEVVHTRLKGVSERAQERWIKRGFGAGVDGVVLVGLLICLGLVAGEVDRCRGGCEVQEAGVILGFLGFGLLLISVFDFGNPELVKLGISIEKSGSGILKLGTSLEFGEEDEEEEIHRPRRSLGGNGGSRVTGEDVV